MRAPMIKHIIIPILITVLLILPAIAIESQQPTQPINIVSTDLPSSFDWRNINGVNYVTSVKNQAPAPTCEAYGLCAALETIAQYKVGYPFGCDLSEAHLYFYANGTVARGGVSLTGAADYLIEHGVPDEGCFPDPHRPFDAPFASLLGWENRTVKITSWGWVNKTEDAMKQALINYGPLVVAIYSYNDFTRYKGGIYTPKVKTHHGHVVTIVGYNDTERCWIIKNSAGTDWGEQGYARVSYDADTTDHPFFATFYGGTGIMYIDGAYGNFMPDVPHMEIIQPAIFHTYISGFSFPTLFKKGILSQKGAPKLIGITNVIVNATNTDKVEFYVDGNLEYTDEQTPFEWTMHTSKGLHTLEAYAYHNDTLSKDIVDVYTII